MTLEIGIFEDNPALSLGVETYLSTVSKYSVEISFNESTPDAFLKSFKKQRPAILVMDVISEGVWGTELFEKVFKIDPDIAVLAYSNIRNVRIIQSLFSLGIRAFIPKTAPLSEFDVALDAVFKKGEIYLPEELKQLHFSSQKTTIISLTRREKEILQLLIQGKSSKELSNELFISVNTADFHKKNLFAKFQVNNIAELIKEAMEQGFSQDTHHL